MVKDNNQEQDWRNHLRGPHTYEHSQLNIRRPIIPSIRQLTAVN